MSAHEQKIKNLKVTVAKKQDHDGREAVVKLARDIEDLLRYAQASNETINDC